MNGTIPCTPPVRLHGVDRDFASFFLRRSSALYCRRHTVCRQHRQIYHKITAKLRRNFTVEMTMRLPQFRINQNPSLSWLQRPMADSVINSDSDWMYNIFCDRILSSLYILNSCKATRQYVTMWPHAQNHLVT